MIKFVGNYSNLVDWPEIIKNLENKFPAIIKSAEPEHFLNPSILEPDFTIGEYEKKVNEGICAKWIKADYCFNSARWIVYRVIKHYPEYIEKIMCDVLNIDLSWSLIARVDPGYNVPMHVDHDDDSTEFSSSAVRFIMQISPPDNGQILCVEDQALTNLKVGDTYCWNDYLDYHGAANIGLRPVYYFTIEGYPRKNNE
jgi:hypothetical protein